MYIPAFWAGVIATVLVELLTLFVIGVFKQEEGSEHGED